MQIQYFFKDIHAMAGKNKLRWIILIFSRAFWGIWLYRFERSLYLLLGKSYIIIRVLFTPIFNLIQAYSNIEIHYMADVGPGLNILHPSIGIVIAAEAKIGKQLTLTGGNVIGISKPCTQDQFVIGDSIMMGANSNIIGPLKLGNKIKIGAGATVVKSCETDHLTLIGTPAKAI